jgi:hypothetical protein
VDTPFATIRKETQRNAKIRKDFAKIRNVWERFAMAPKSIKPYIEGYYVSDNPILARFSSF